MAVEQGPVPMLDHLHITVGDLSRAEAFYDRLLPLFGYDLGLKERTEDPEHEFMSVSTITAGSAWALSARVPALPLTGRTAAGPVRCITWR